MPPSGCRWIPGPVDPTLGCFEFQLDCFTSCPIYDTTPGCSVIAYKIVDDCPMPITDCSSNPPQINENAVQAEDGSIAAAIANELVPMVSKRY